MSISKLVDRLERGKSSSRGTFPLIVNIEKCGKCHRKILVDNEVKHLSHPQVVYTAVTCWDCLSNQEKEAAKKLYPWLAGRETD
ncbi:MAG: hypothetical protein AAB343_02610 [Patescibacteria group bacterium]